MNWLFQVKIILMNLNYPFKVSFLFYFLDARIVCFSLGKDVSNLKFCGENKRNKFLYPMIQLWLLKP